MSRTPRNNRINHQACFAFVIVFLTLSCCSVTMSGSPASVPSWAKRAVWYQVFPERFRNGDMRNDPTVNDLRGSWPHVEPEQWTVSPWTADWYKLQPWELQDDRGFYFHAQQRRYGGDLQGVIDKLDYLKDLGINAVYVNPLFESPSLHKYDATSYHHVDDNFGPDPAGDKAICAMEDPADPTSWKWTSADRIFLKLIQETHKRGMKIIIDGVFHCTGSTFWAFQDLKLNQQRSDYKDWYIVKKWDDPMTASDEFDYEGWFGVRELPELHEVGGTLATGPREHIRAVVKRWMDPNGDGNPEDGIDGWRLDAAEMAPMGFWKELRTWVREVNPEAFLTAELWWEDWANDKIFNAEPWLRGDQFDAVMNYRWTREVVRFFVGETTAISPSEFDRRLADLRDDYRPDVNTALMNLMDSHDTDRLASQIVNVDSRYDHNIGVNDNRGYNVGKPDANHVRTQKLIALFQMTYPGAPMIYYGTEAGMWGADDPDERKPMLWPDMKYEDETRHPFGISRSVDKNEFDEDLFNWYKQLIHIRTSEPALSAGDFATLAALDDSKVFAFKRSLGNEHVVVAVNSSRETQNVVLPFTLGTMRLTTLIGEEKPQVNERTVSLSLGPKSGIIIKASQE